MFTGKLVRESHPRTNSKPPASLGWAIEHGFWLKKEGYKESTIERRVRILRTLAKYSDLADPEGVKQALARMEWSEGTNLDKLQFWKWTVENART